MPPDESDEGDATAKSKSHETQRVTEPDAESKTPPATAEWLEAAPGITADMRAHLGRRQKKAEADLIVRNRGPVLGTIFGLGRFLHSRYFANVRKSLGAFMGMWFWYVLNTKTCASAGLDHPPPLSPCPPLPRLASVRLLATPRCLWFWDSPPQTFLRNLTNEESIDRNDWRECVNTLDIRVSRIPSLCGRARGGAAPTARRLGVHEE